MYIKNKFFYETLKNITKKRKKNFYINLINCYKILIKEKFLKKRNEFFKAWIQDCKIYYKIL